MTNLVLVLVKHWLSGKSRHVALHLVTCGLFIACPSLLLAQSYTSSTGTPSFAAPYPVEMGQVDAASGDLHLELPIATYPQRGGATTRLSIAYDSHIWAIQPNGASPFWSPHNAPAELLPGGWYVAISGGWLATLSPQNPACTFDQEVWEPTGTAHWFHVNLGSGTLTSGCSLSSASTYAVDSSGFKLVASYALPNLSFTLYAPDGTLVMQQAPVINNPQFPKDSNGNYMSGAFGGAGSGTDTLGRQFLKLPVSPASCLFQSVHPGGQYYACYQVLTSQGVSNYQSYGISFADIPLKTSFQWSGVTECTTNCYTTVVTGVSLPDGSHYSFLYDCDSTTGNTACNSLGGQTAYYGTLTKMTLPTGAAITYGYSIFGGVSIGNNQNQFPSQRIVSKSSNQGTWLYTPNVTAGAGPQNTCLPGFQLGCDKVTVSRPDGSVEVTSFIVDPYGGAWPATVQSYDRDGTTLLSTVQNTWDFSNSCTLTFCPSGFGYQYVRRLSTSTTLPIPGGNLTKKTTYSYDSALLGNITSIKQWKFQSGTAPTFPTIPDRATYITYATIGSNNNVNRPLSETTCTNSGTDTDCPGGGSKASKTLVTYDGYGTNGSLALASVTGVVNHDDTNFGSTYTARGNPTQISHWVSGTSYLTTALSYDTTGQVIKTVDSAGNAETLSYADNFYDDNGADPPLAASPTPPTTNAYLTQLTDSIGSTRTGYYYGSGKSAVSTDYNSVVTYKHFRDPFDRPTQVDYPIGWALNVYTSPTQVDSYTAVGDAIASAACSNCIHTQANLDTFGRMSSGNLANNPLGPVSITTSYDNVGRVSTTSHPFIGSTDPNNVVESPAYDGLGRIVGLKHPDGQMPRLAYGVAVTRFGGRSTQLITTGGLGFPVVSMDEAGNGRQEWIDGFGNLIEVDEPTASTLARSTATVTVSGSEGSNTTCNPKSGDCHTIWDTGTLSITVNGFVAAASWGRNSTSSTVAASLTGALNSSNSPVTATLSGTAITMTAVAPGAFSFPFSVSSTATDFTASPTSGSLTGGSGGLSASPVGTGYTYNVLGKLIAVAQGVQTRTYQYDGLSRMTQEVTPEGGTVAASYLNASNAPCSGVLSNICSKTAPAPNQTGTATVTTTYTYDAAGRLTQKSHSDTSGTETFTYGTTAANYSIGRIVTVTDPSGSQTYLYDRMGRITSTSKTVGGTTYTIGYQYNPGGELTQITYPSGRVVQHSYDSVGHLCIVAPSAAPNCGTSTSPFLTIPSGSYDGASRPLSGTYGNGVNFTASYSPQRSQLASLTYAKGTTSLFGLNYVYQKSSPTCTSGNALGNNSQIQCITDTVQSGRSAAYVYDGLSRLSTANTTGSTAYPAWGLSETYDRYGNRTGQSVTAGSGFNVALTISATNNQISGFTYDSAGDVISQPSPGSATFTYDADHCQTGFVGNGNTATYICDGQHLRTKKMVTGTNAVTTVYIYSGGRVIDEYDNGAAVNAPSREYIYGHSLLATVVGSVAGAGGTLTYQHRDHLSPRLYTDTNGNNVGEQGTYPFGESWYRNNATSNWVFTEYERDQESGNDYALARSYSNGLGRFMSPDPWRGRANNPQSWNRYAYALNDPINFSDPTGQGFWRNLFNFLLELFTLDAVNLDGGGWLGLTEEVTHRIVIPQWVYFDAAIGVWVGTVLIGDNGPGSVNDPTANRPESTSANPDGTTQIAQEVDPMEDDELDRRSPDSAWGSPLEPLEPIEPENEPVWSEGSPVRYNPFTGPLDYERVGKNFQFYYSMVLQKPTTYYRVWGQPATLEGSPNGLWLSAEPPAGTMSARIDFAVKPEWNSMEHINEVVVPAGSTVYIGPASVQSGNNGFLLGGGIQVFVPPYCPVHP